MNKQQFGYKLGKLYLKFNGFIRQKAEQYKLPVPLVYVLMYMPVVILVLFSFMLFAIITAGVIGLMVLAYIVAQDNGNASDYDDENSNENGEGLRYGESGYGYYDEDGWLIIGDDD